MSISSEITRITEAKADIVSALAEKGVSVASGASISDMGDYIRSIEAGVDMLELFPVGAIYISRSATSPASRIGGTWEQIKDRFLLGAGDTYAGWSTGGSATHTLITSEMPNHSGHIAGMGSGSLKAYLGTGALTSYGSTGRGWTSPSSGEALPATTSTGGGAAHNNMPPYRTVYIWVRTA